jgi:hypothetical protein
MPDITVFNLWTAPMTIPGGHYTAAIPIGGVVTFPVPEVDAYLEDSRVQSLVAGGYIRIEPAGIGAAYHASLVTYVGGGTSTTVNVPGVRATDIVVATLNASANATYVTKAVRTAADTVTITFAANPGAATTVGLVIYRP